MNEVQLEHNSEFVNKALALRCLIPLLAKRAEKLPQTVSSVMRELPTGD